MQCSRLQDTGVALLLATSTIAAACAQGNASPRPPAPSTPRLVGYLSAPKGVNLADSIKTLDLSRMTDLNLAFGDPPKCDGTCTAQSDMEFSVKGQMDTDIDAVVAAAHAAGVKVFLSVGGGGGDQMIIQFYNAGLSASLVASLDISAHTISMAWTWILKIRPIWGNRMRALYPCLP
jgi:chitinase